MNNVRPSIAGPLPAVRDEIASFAHSLRRNQEGKLPDAVFLEYRLRFGVYGQRQDGVHMMRSKLPLGLISPDQMRAFADVAERFGHGVSHLTTRQDIQVHFIPLEKSPEVMEVLAEAEMTSREACGNVVRNVCASPLSGVLPGEAFDVTEPSMALAQFLLRHPDGQSLGRKFKITLASSDDDAYAGFNLAAIHDVGATARVRDGVRGFELRVGGGLGAVPHEAPVLFDFVAEDALIPHVWAILRIFARHGEKKNRARARLKFLAAKLGADGMRDMIRQELEELPNAVPLDAGDGYADGPKYTPDNPAFPAARDEAEGRWLERNVIRQSQDGYSTVRVVVPYGDFSPEMLRAFADVADAHAGDTSRIGWDQAMYIRWVPNDRLIALKDALESIGLQQASTRVADPVTCPGSDTCKLGITSPRSLARSIQSQLEELSTVDARVASLRVHVSGCPNSCAQTQIADIGLFGASRTKDGYVAPLYVMLLGGRPNGVSLLGEKPGSGFAQVTTKIPALRVGTAIETVANDYIENSEPNEFFSDYVRRQGRAHFRKLLSGLTDLPAPTEDAKFYAEPGHSEPFVLERGVGECAGEMVADYHDFLLAEAESKAEASEEGFAEERPSAEIASAAHEAIRLAIRALLAVDGERNHDNDQLLAAFRTGWYDTGRIPEGVGYYAIEALEQDTAAAGGDRLRRLITEARLFVEKAFVLTGQTKLAEAAQ